MSKVPDNRIAVLDVGSSKTIALVGEIGDGGLRYRGHGATESRGTRKAVITELDKATATIHKAVELAEASADMTIDRLVVSVAGPHIRGINSRGGIALGSRPREVNREDVRQAVERARSVSLPSDRQTLHLLPQEFVLDEQGSIHDPAGMVGTRLEVNSHIVTAAASAVQNVVTAANRAGLSVEDVVFEPLAAAECTLRPDERELGCCLVDIGSGSCDLIVFYEGAVAFTGSVPIGGDHFTNDVAVGLRTPLADAEKIKKLFGCAVVTNIPEQNEIEVPAVGDRPSRLMPQRLLAEILEPRARELFELVRDALRQAGVMETLGAGCVLTGGGARLLAIAEICEQVMRCPARIAQPVALPRMPMQLGECEYSTAVGLLMYAHRARVGRVQQEQGLKAKLRSLFAGA